MEINIMRGTFFISWLSLVLALIAPHLTYAQKTAALTGYVTDAATGKPMPFANVYVNGSTNGAVTDERGAYKLAAIPLGTVEIVASFVGYQAATRKIRFDNTSAQKADFQLKASEQMLDAVTIRGNSKSWERNLRKFRKAFFGEPFGNQCVLLNSETLHFKEDKAHLYATAGEPLLIENQALGYRVIYDLQYCDVAPSGKVYFAGAARFEELPAGDERQANRYRRNRLAAYKGSTRHLMRSLIDNTLDQAGFMVYQEDPTKPIPAERKSTTLAAATSEYKRLIPVQPSALIQPGRLPVERRLVSPMKLIVFYTRATSGFSPYPDARYAYTEITLPRGQMQLTIDGLITMPEGMEAQGSMGNDRVSTMLPADWKPESGEQEESANATLATQGKLAPLDRVTDSISTVFNTKFKILAPTLFLHIDKPVYVTGDLLWLSAYLLDATTYKRPGGETAMHVELLTSTGKKVEHQWIRIVDGRGQGHFRLSDTLTNGNYRLRAYTDEDHAQKGPTFERAVAIYNPTQNNSLARQDSATGQLDIRILPEGGRWIAGLPARLGIKVTQPNGLGLAIIGRIVDDAGVEITQFTTSRQGITSVSVQPAAGRNYFAEVTYNEFRQRVPLPQPELKGLLLSADAVTDSTELALTISSADQTSADSINVLVQQRGRIVDQRKIILQRGVAKVTLPMTGWLPGLAQVTVFDAKAHPQAERLVFVPEFIPSVSVALKLNKPVYQPREQVTLSVNLDDDGGALQAALSASVTDISKVPDDSLEADLRTHLLLTGELRGRVENPKQYVADNRAATRRALDDLLLTQGWRRVNGTADADTLCGLSLRGRILNHHNQPISGAQLTVALTTPGKSFVKSAIADEQGRVQLTGLNIADTVTLVVQIADRKLRKLSAKEATFVQEDAGISWETNKISVMPDLPLPSHQTAAAQIRRDANDGVYQDKTAKNLKEVTVRARKEEERPDDIKQRSLHNEADAVVVFNEKSPSYSNLYEMIQGRFSGVTVVKTVAGPDGSAAPGYSVSVRGGNSFKSGTQPLYLLDGVPIQDPDGTALLNFNPRDIERVEVLKNAGTAGIYGIRGGNGVIAFYSKGARSMRVDVKTKEITTPITYTGYPSVHREFYVPRYDLESAADTTTSRIDNRDVIYWKPLMQTDSRGHTQLKFPLSDEVRTLRVVIQGVTADGHPVSSVQVVRVR